MQIISTKCINKQKPAWLLCIAFLLSTALFTGLTGSTNHHFQSIQTCWNWSAGKNDVAKNTIAYHYASAPSAKTNASIKVVSFQFVLLHFTRLTQLKITTAQKIYNAAKPTYFIRAQRIPNNASSETSPSLSFAV